MGREVEEARATSGIGQLVVLPWSRAIQMTKQNIFVRLGRSVITALGIFLGIAFLAAVLFSSAATRVKAGLDLQELGLEHEVGEIQARTIWLVAMSLLVATVGIVNSMLMSVTERYKEIGTMKCLGALDSFIVRLFVLEAGMLGVLGSAVGAVLGAGLMTVIYGLRAGFGWQGAISTWTATAMTLGSWQLPLWLAVLLGIAIGGVLSVLAALYPASRAAKMPPAAALRSEF